MTPPPDTRAPGAVLLVSCYELGHQPLAVASAAGFLERAGFRPSTIDLAVEPLVALDAPARAARLVAISVPMHTALRVGTRAARRVRDVAPGAHVSFFGHYATLNGEHLLAELADSTIGGEAEEALVALAQALGEGRDPASVQGVALPDRPASPVLRRLSFAVPRRETLPAPARYARFEAAGRSVVAAAIEGSRGCLHRCLHCPIPPVYGGRFFVVPREVVLEDVRGLVASGVRHLTFADPDFLNGPGHSLALVREIARRFPGLTFDVTTKVEHVLRHRGRLAELADCGCAFVVSAVESLSDRVLGELRKGHTREDVFRALEALRAAGLVLRPSFLPFTPWATRDDFAELLDWVASEDLVDHVDPVQYSIRLLIPPGSPLAEAASCLPHLRGLDRASFSWRWAHPDPSMDALQAEVARVVEAAAREGTDPWTTFDRVRDAAGTTDGHPAPDPTLVHLARRERRPAPRLSEPWFC